MYLLCHADFQRWQHPSKSGLFHKCVNVHASARLLLLHIRRLQIVCCNRPASALWNGSHLILFRRVKLQHDMLFYSVTFGCSEPADCIRCEVSPPLLLWATCNGVSVGLLSESVGHADTPVTNTIRRKLLLRKTFVFAHSCFSLFDCWTNLHKDIWRSLNTAW